MNSQLVLFVCTHNKGRSQIANAFFNQLAEPDKARSVSAGLEPVAQVSYGDFIASEMSASRRVGRRAYVMGFKMAERLVLGGTRRQCAQYGAAVDELVARDSRRPISHGAALR